MMKILYLNTKNIKYTTIFYLNFKIVELSPKVCLNTIRFCTQAEVYIYVSRMRMHIM